MNKNVQINGDMSILNESQRNIVLSQAKGMADHWKSITICWYSDGSRAYIVESITGEIFPSIIL